MFSKEQIKFMEKIGLSIDFENPSDDELVLVEEKVSLFLQENGFDENYEPTEECEICEEILDVI